MSNEAVQFLSGFIPLCWKYFTSWYLPGTKVTPAAMALFVSGLFIVIRTINRIANCPTGDMSPSNFGGSNLPVIRR